MKLRLILPSILLATALFNCTPDPEVVTQFVTTDETLEGDITSDLTLDASKVYVMKGGVHVKEGAVLTIPAGTLIRSDRNSTGVSYLLIERGGKIMANGTATDPIVFTSGKATPQRGDWGGIIVCGKAPINVGTEANAEVGNVLYGGNDANDNSGVLRYVRVEYTGNAINADKEHNGFTFNGVGSGTQVEYLQAYRGNDDGFEFFGGTVNAKYLVSTESKDDSFDWTFGWVGKGQFWLATQSTTMTSDRGIEADNNGPNNSATPFSNPTLSNITLLGAEDGDMENTGMRLREGTKGIIHNAIVSGFPNNGVRVSTQQSQDNMNNGDLVVANSMVFGNGTDWKDCEPFANDASNSSDATAFTSGFVSNVSSSFDPASIDAWFTSASFKGAVNEGNNWTSGWTRL